MTEKAVIRALVLAMLLFFMVALFLDRCHPAIAPEPKPSPSFTHIMDPDD